MFGWVTATGYTANTGFETRQDPQSCFKIKYKDHFCPIMEQCDIGPWFEFVNLCKTMTASIHIMIVGVCIDK